MSQCAYILEIKASSPQIQSLYESRANHPGDAGVDLYVPVSVEIPTWSVSLVDLGIQCRMWKTSTGELVSYYLYPRSSLIKTPLQLANSVGIIDRDYRGAIKAAFRCFPQADGNAMSYKIAQGDRLVQLCAPTLEPIEVRLVESLEDTVRGTGGFGSTGR